MSEGGCLCGAVRYRVRGQLRDVVFCHCAQCRRQTGSFYAATAAKDCDLVLESDAGLRWFRSSGFARRGFCGTCGTALFWKADSADYTAILAGSLDDPSDLRAGFHICTAGRPAYDIIADGLPCHPHDAPGLPIDGA